MSKLTSSDETHKDFCPVAQVAELLGDPCTLLIVRDLLTGDKRFKELESSLSPMSSRTITLKLKKLEEKNIITRTAYNERPPRVVYSLTKQGRALSTLMDDMRKYGNTFLK